MDEIAVVSAREIYEIKKSTMEFEVWFSDICRFAPIENDEYTPVNILKLQQSEIVNDYLLPLITAYKIFGFLKLY